MIVFHGTAKSSVENLILRGPWREPRAYLRGKSAFSTTLDFNIAAMFALRRSPEAVLHDESVAGNVVEYELSGLQGWVRASCPGVLQDEKEIAILEPSILKVLAVWKMENGEWVRYERRVTWRKSARAAAASGK